MNETVARYSHDTRPARGRYLFVLSENQYAVPSVKPSLQGKAISKEQTPMLWLRGANSGSNLYDTALTKPHAQ